jgi:hypothetical protein
LNGLSIILRDDRRIAQWAKANRLQASQMN